MTDLPGDPAEAVMLRVMRANERGRRSIVDLGAGLVFQLARELGVTLQPLSGGRLHVQGPEARVAFLASALRRHKAALLAGACTCCRHNLAERPNGKCAACATIGARTYVYVPGSVAERAFLEALAANVHHPNAAKAA